MGMAEPVKEAEVNEAETELSSAEAILEMILMKEDEIKQRVQRAENEAQRLVEEAKLDAAQRKREAIAEDVGGDLREKEMARAQAEAEKVATEIAGQADEIRTKGKERFNDAIGVVIEGVLPPLE
jgi:replication-associated recombination protein RarA